MTKDQVRSTEEALKLALEALGNVAVTGPDDDGIVWINLPGNGTTGKAILRVGKSGLIAAQCAKLYEEQRTEAITAIKQARSAPVQEPVAIVSGYYGGQCVILPTEPARLFNSGTAFYTTPPNVAAPLDETASLAAPAPEERKRQWQGLTDEEKQEWIDAMPYTIEPRHCMILVNVMEAKLKEKNSD